MTTNDILVALLLGLGYALAIYTAILFVRITEARHKHNLKEGEK